MESRPGWPRFAMRVREIMPSRCEVREVRELPGCVPDMQHHDRGLGDREVYTVGIPRRSEDSDRWVAALDPDFGKVGKSLEPRAQVLPHPVSRERLATLEQMTADDFEIRTRPPVQQHLHDQGLVSNSSASAAVRASPASASFSAGSRTAISSADRRYGSASISCRAAAISRRRSSDSRLARVASASMSSFVVIRR